MEKDPIVNAFIVKRNLLCSNISKFDCHFPYHTVRGHIAHS